MLEFIWCWLWRCCCSRWRWHWRAGIEDAGDAFWSVVAHGDAPMKVKVCQFPLWTESAAVDGGQGNGVALLMGDEGPYFLWDVSAVVVKEEALG